MNTKKLTIGIAVAVVVAQLIPLPRTNPPVSADVGAPAEVARVLKTACYDCHSNETTWPWYAWVAPASWLVVYDVHEGRDHLNFSEWDKLTPDRRRHKFEEIAEEVEEGEMPPAIYFPMHPEADLDAAQRQAVVAWAKRMRVDRPQPAAAPQAPAAMTAPAAVTRP